MAEVINAEQAAEICGVPYRLFHRTRRGVGAPKPLPKARANIPDSYDAAEMRSWALTHNFWELACDYKYGLRYGDKPRRNIRARKEYKAPNPPKGEVSKEILSRYESEKLRPELKQFLLGHFAPAPVRVAQDMKLMRARMNKPTTTRVHIPGDGSY
jgi:hypothetical protein